MSEQDLNLVPGKEHYAAKYVLGGRLFSYAHQMNAVLEREPRTVLEIGPGPGMVTAALRSIDIDVTTVDIQPELKPDVVASVTELPFADDSFDVSMCCQVLEHLPFDQFLPALKELGRVSRTAVVISLPDCTPHYTLHLRLPKFHRVTYNWSRRVSPSQNAKDAVYKRDGHYWEIGYPGTRLIDLRNILANHIHIDRSWRVPECPYHRFIVLTEKH